jgi:SAM-dependent methyltransferase
MINTGGRDWPMRAFADSTRCHRGGVYLQGYCNLKQKLDIGCGRNKNPEFFGIDIYDWPGVDLAWDLEEFPWPIEDESFEYIRVSHVVEHINEQVGFFREIHRVAKNHAVVHLETPHYSSRDSWSDPTHVRHFSLFFTDQMCGDGYLVDPVGRFELINRRVNFGPLFGSIRARLISSLRGYERWERSAFRLPARNIYIDLKVIK